MSGTRIILLVVMLSSLTLNLNAQKEKRGPKKDTEQITPQNAGEAQKKDRDAKVDQYHMKKDYHTKAQDKETRKRMKKNLKRAEKHSWGKDVPWYKRWFRKKRFS